MPLRKVPKGATKKQKQAVVSANIRAEKRSHPTMPQKQKVAIALRAAGVPKKRKKK